MPLGFFWERYVGSLLGPSTEDLRFFNHLKSQEQLKSNTCSESSLDQNTRQFSLKITLDFRFDHMVMSDCLLVQI